MSSLSLLSGVDAQLRRAVVVAIDRDGLRVSPDGPDSTVISCDLLETAATATRLSAGDVVLVVAPGGAGERGIVLGRVMPGSTAAERDRAAVPDELVLEATRSLTLRVGDGTITLREDGKILIRGKDLVSHAQRMNRIKGGAVSIN